MPLDILAEPLNSRGKIVQLEIQASDGPDLFHDFASPRCKLLMTPHTSSYSHRNSNQFLRPKPKENVQPVVLRPKPQNPLEKHNRYASSTISTRVTIVFDRPVTKSSSAFAWLGQPLSWLSQQCLLLCMSSSLLQKRFCEAALFFSEAGRLGGRLR
jgi:hypothetical protein